MTQEIRWAGERESPAEDVLTLLEHGGSTRVSHLWAACPSPSQASGQVASAQSLGLLDCPGGLAWTLWPRGLTAGRLHVPAVPGLWWMRRKHSFLPLGSERENHIEGVSSAVSGGHAPALSQSPSLRGQQTQKEKLSLGSIFHRRCLTGQPRFQYYLLITFICLVHVLGGECHGTCVGVRGPLIGVGSLLPPCGFRELDSSPQT